jgi:magnesium transporter
VQLDSRPAVVDCALYVGGVRQADDLPLAELYERALERPDAFVWIGLHEPDPDQFTDVEKVFGLHPLAVEDALKPAPQRPKVERYEDVTFFVARTARYLPHGELTESSEVIDTGSIRMFLGAQFIVTVRHGEAGELRSARLDLEARSWTGSSTRTWSSSMPSTPTCRPWRRPCSAGTAGPASNTSTSSSGS